MRDINYERLIKEIERLKQDERFKYTFEAIAALEQVMYWAEEEAIPTINKKL